MKSVTDTIGFAEFVVNYGHVDGIFNFNLGTKLFSPDETGTKVVPDPAISCRLRITETCARQLRDNLEEMLQAIDKKRAGNGDAHGIAPAAVDGLPEGTKAN